MQVQAQSIDFDYTKSIDLLVPEGVAKFDLNTFVGPSWVNPAIDELWVKNFEVNRSLRLKRFPYKPIGNKVVVLVGASPAVLKNIDALKCLDDNFVIVACNTIYRRLVLEGCRVDYVFAVEARDHIARDFDVQRVGTDLVVSQFVCPKVPLSWTAGITWLYYLDGGVTSSAAVRESGIDDPDIGGGNVVSTAACWAYKYLGARHLILIGTSFCYYGDYYHDKRSTEHVCDFSNEELKIKAVDIYGELVNVTPAQLSYKTWLENFIRHAPNANFINATEDGTLGVIPEIVNFDGDNGQYRVRYLPWINIVPFTVAVEAYKTKFKEMNQNGIG